MFNRHPICMMCHEKNDTKYLHKLNHLERLLHNAIHSKDLVKYRYINFMWGIHSHCRYGIHCPTLSNNDSKANRIANDLEAYIVTAALSDDKQLYHDILQLLRGEFPSVYRLVEDIHNGRYKNHIIQTDAT